LRAHASRSAGEKQQQLVQHCSAVTQPQPQSQQGKSGAPVGAISFQPSGNGKLVANTQKAAKQAIQNVAGLKRLRSITFRLNSSGRMMKQNFNLK
jgi:hypothetical protein